MNKIIVGIGSNVVDAKERVEECCRLLSQISIESRFSSVYETEAVGTLPQPNYHNCVGVLSVIQSFDELKQKFKEMEREAGRMPEHKMEGKVIIDIDIVVWNNEIIKPTDLARTYMTIGMEELNISVNQF